MMARPVRAEIGIVVDQASSLSTVADLIRASCSTITASVEVSQKYERSLNCNDLSLSNWKLTPNPTTAAASMIGKNFRLISPPLKVDADYQTCAEFLRKVEAIPSVTLNTNTGFRIHVSAKGLKCDGFVRLCQNYVKYEDAIDAALPPSRRSGSAASQSYFKSNKSAINRSTKKERNDEIGSCRNTEYLVLLLNPDGRNYKLNIQNLRLRHPMIEFRSHSATSNKQKIQSWIGLCLALVGTAEEGTRSPSAFKESRTLDEEFDGLLKNIVKKQSIRDFLEIRKKALAPLTKKPGVKRSLNDGKKKSEKKKECECCFQKCDVATMCACQEKDHWFCNECVKEYTKVQLFANLKSRLQCMSTEGCSSDLNTLHLKKLLSKNMLAKLHEVEYAKSVERTKKVLCECPKCGSQATLPKKERTLSCPLDSCRHQSCRTCREPAHEPLKCSEIEKTVVTEARSLIEESMTDAYVRKCPRCYVAFVRDSGCNKITCSNCNVMSCYICRKQIQSVSHFNDLACPLYSGDDLTDRQNVRTAGTNAEQRAQRDLGVFELEGLAQNLL